MEDGRQGHVRSLIQLPRGKDENSEMIIISLPILQSSSSWTSMNTGRWGLRMEVVEGRIFAIGGGTSSGEVTSLGTRQKWMAISSMANSRAYFASVVLGSSIFVTGGFGGSYLGSAEKYSTRQDKWTTLPSMNSKRRGHGLIAFKGRLLAFGGYDGSKYLCSMESLDPESTNGWTEEKFMLPECKRSFAWITQN